MLSQTCETSFGCLPYRQRFPRCKMIRHRIFGTLATTTVLLAVCAMCPGWMPVRGAADDPPRSDNSLKPGPPASQSDFLAEMFRNLKTQHERMIELANRRPAGPVDPGSVADQLLNQQITTESAKSNYQNSALTRQVAEMAVLEYTAGIFAMDKATADGELALARNDVNRQKIGVEAAKGKVAQAERTSNGSATDLSIKFRYAEGITYFQCEERKAELELEKAEAKVSMLVEYTKPIRMRELKAEVALARADELAKKAILELEMTKANRLAAASGQNTSAACQG